MNHWEAATGSELDAIHDGACQVLEEAGVRFRSDEIVDVLTGLGATRTDDYTVRIPRSVVERSIESAPATFRMYDRRGTSMEIGGDDHQHLVGGTMTEVLEYPGRTRRPARLQDVADVTRLVDALDCVHIAIPAAEGRDAPPGMGEILSCAAMLKNTSKVCFACPVEARANRAFVEMAKAIAGTDGLSDRPTIGLLVTMLPGYEMDEQASQVLLLAAASVGRRGRPPWRGPLSCRPPRRSPLCACCRPFGRAVPA